MTTTADVTIDAVRSAAYTVPSAVPEADGTLSWDSTTFVSCEVDTGPVTGFGYTYAGASCTDIITNVLSPQIVGIDALDVPRAWTTMQHAIRNLGRPGLVSCAMAAVETALYDAKARLLDVALMSLFGRCHQTVSAYGSGGFTSYDDDTTRQELEHWINECGLSSVKIKIGESRGTRPERDLDRVRLARRVIGDDTELFVDANGGYSVGQAVRVGHALTNHGVTWYEEPVSSDHLASLQHVRHHVTLDVTAGEYGYDLPYFAAMIDAQAVDCLQIDVTRCGGYDEWLRAAGLAAAHGIEISGHCAPNLSAHVAAATPNLRHLEYFRDHERIENMLLDGVLEPRDGVLRPDPSRAGHGLRLKHVDAEPYRVH